MSYLSYAEYTDMGGSLDESTFSSLLLDVETKLNYLTSGRIPQLEEVPPAVKQLCFKLISIYNENAQSLQSGGSLTSYSNGIESFNYASSDNSKGSTSMDERIFGIVKEYLWEYPELLYRGRKCKQKR